MLKLPCAMNTFVKKERINGVKLGAFAVNEKKSMVYCISIK